MTDNQTVSDVRVKPRKSIYRINQEHERKTGKPVTYSLLAKGFVQARGVVFDFVDLGEPLVDKIR